MNNTDEKNELLAALALDSLDEAEARRLVAQITSNAELAGELEMWREVAASLAYAAEPAEPAPLIRENILAAIRKTPQNSKSEQGAENGASATVTAIGHEQPTNAPRKIPAKATVWSLPIRSKNSFWRLAPILSAVAASSIAIVLGISLYNAAQNNKLKSDQIAELNQQITIADQKTKETQIQLERERQERDLLASPASFVKALDGTKESPTAKARLVFDPKTGRAFLSVEGLPAPPPGKTYQIWFISDPKHIAPGKTFETDQNGKGVLRDQIPSVNLKAGVFAITLEPSGGSEVPTGSILLKTEA